MSNPKKRVLISGGMATGGIQTHVSILCKELLRAGADVTIVATLCDWPADVVEELKASGLRIQLSPLRHTPLQTLGKVYSGARLLITPASYDAVYCIGYSSMHQYAMKKVNTNGKTLYHEIVDCPDAQNPVTRIIPKVTQVVANSLDVEARMKEKWPDAHYAVLPFLTLDKSATPPAPRRPIGKNSQLRISYLGRVVSHKRPDFLVQQWRAIEEIEGVGPARLDIYGDDTDLTLLNELKEFVTAQKIHDRVQLHGRYSKSELQRILSESDLVVLPSLFEGLPLVLVEAMLAGVPVVTTNAGGSSELGKDNPDVIVTSTDWHDFLKGLATMTNRMREGQVNSMRLYEWTNARYGYETTAERWHRIILSDN